MNFTGVGNISATNDGGVIKPTVISDEDLLEDSGAAIDTSSATITSASGLPNSGDIRAEAGFLASCGSKDFYLEGYYAKDASGNYRQIGRLTVTCTDTDEYENTVAASSATATYTTAAATTTGISDSTLTAGLTSFFGDPNSFGSTASSLSGVSWTDGSGNKYELYDDNNDTACSFSVNTDGTNNNKYWIADKDGDIVIKKTPAPPTLGESGDPGAGIHDKSDKAVYTPDKTNGLTVISNTGGVDKQISGFTISILDKDGNIKKDANAALNQFNVIENALTKALDQQTTIGAIEARLEYTGTNLTTSSDECPGGREHDSRR